MSKGNGPVQSQCLSALRSSVDGLTTKEVCERLKVTYWSKEARQCWKSLTGMAKRGEIARIGRRGLRGPVVWKATDKGEIVADKGQVLHRLDQCPMEIQHEVDAKIAAAVALDRAAREQVIGFLVIAGKTIVGGFKTMAEAEKALSGEGGRRVLTVLDNNPFSAP